MIAALYDIHGNLPALEAVLRDVHRSGANEIVIGGDVLPGPMPRECFAALAAVDLPVRYIMGNGDREILLRMRGETSSAVPPRFEPMMQWVAAQLNESHAQAIASWPATLKVGETLFVHATPRNDVDIFTRATPADALLPIFEPAHAALVVCGHTHMQFDRAIGTTRVVNAGSVGMPFGEPGAYWALIGETVELRRTSYDLARAAEHVRATAYPDAESFAATSILSPAAESAMVELYSRVSLT